MNIAVLSYAAAATAYLLVFGLGVLVRGQTRIGWLVAVAAITTATWAALESAAATGVPISAEVIRTAVIARHLTWFLLLRRLGGAGFPHWIGIAALAVIALDILQDWARIPQGLADALEVMLRFPRPELLLSLAGLVVVEQYYRAGEVSGPRGSRLLALGIGGQFAYDLFLLSQAELLGGMDQTAWMTRGFVFAALTPCVIYGFRHTDRERSLFVSRHVVFYGTAIVSIGLYLLAMAIGGHYVRLLGRSWGPLLQFLFLIGAAVVLASVLVRGGLSRRLRVFIATHFYRNRYDYRIEWLRFVATLSTAQGTDLGRVSIQAVARVIGSPGGFLLLRASHGGVFRAHSAWPESLQARTSSLELAEDAPLVRFLAERRWVMQVEEYRKSPAKYAEIPLPDWLRKDPAMGIVVPLLTNNWLNGLLFLQSPPQRLAMNFEDHDLLRTLGRHISVHIAQQVADQRLAENRQFDAYSRLAAFVMHDLKNSVAQLQLVVSNAARHRGNPAFIDDAIDTIANTVTRMTRLIEQLRSPDANRRRRVSLAVILRAAAERAGRRNPAPRLCVVESALQVVADPERLGAVFDHVLRNAQEATNESGSVDIELLVESGWARVIVADDGIGMTPEFMRERLFRPFDSTKGAKGMGIGAFQTREYVREIGGEIEVQSSPGCGTRFCITLPLCQT